MPGEVPVCSECAQPIDVAWEEISQAIIRQYGVDPDDSRIIVVSYHPHCAVARRLIEAEDVEELDPPGVYWEFLLQ